MKTTIKMKSKKQAQDQIVRPVKRTKVWVTVLDLIVFFILIIPAGISGGLISYICIDIGAQTKQMDIAPWLGTFIVVAAIFVMFLLLIITIAHWRSRVNKYNRDMRDKIQHEQNTQEMLSINGKKNKAKTGI